jgi:3'-phosphoadenosine 5'-phosphosulfate sulfotransferase (PAPS reductase)/FAD synthetase
MSTISTPLCKCVVPISGGKDSQACAKLAVEHFGAQHVRGLFCDTQFEHPLTYSHVQHIAQLYAIRIDTVSRGSVPEQIKRYKKFPGGNARFCTYNLKIVPSREYYAELASAQCAGFEVWMGVRAAESAARAKRYAGKIGSDVMPLHEFMPKNYPKRLERLGVLARLPIIDWPTRAVFDFLQGDVNPLYSDGFERVGCFPCLAAGDAHKERAFFYDETGRQHYRIARELEPLVGRPLFTSQRCRNRHNGAQADLFNGCSLCSI